MIPSYEEMLDEAYEELSKIKVSHGSELGIMNIPLPKVNYVGKWTSIENAKNICDVINRDIKLLAQFLQKEFNVPSKIEDGKIILQKKIEFEKIKEKIDKFVDIFVRCPVCKKLDTKLEKKERIYYIKCLVCGAESPVIYDLK
ncbi:MAG: translation initiation factor IF-2 subunit beta [Nanopusillaceae archaeon]|jgi:translation initiation factor 2 subunit 2